MSNEQPATNEPREKRTHRPGLTKMRSIIAVIIISLYVYVQWFLLNDIIAADMREIVMRALGTLDAMLGLVVGYYYGTSEGSSQKTELLARKDPPQ